VCERGRQRGEKGEGEYYLFRRDLNLHGSFKPLGVLRAASKEMSGDVLIHSLLISLNISQTCVTFT